MFKSLKAKVQPYITKAMPWVVWALKAIAIVFVIDTLSVLLFEPTFDSGWYTGFAVAILGDMAYTNTFKEDDNV